MSDGCASFCERASDSVLLILVNLAFLTTDEHFQINELHDEGDHADIDERAFTLLMPETTIPHAVVDFLSCVFNNDLHTPTKRVSLIHHEP